MKKAAIDNAQRKLFQAEKCITHIQQARNFTIFVWAWSDLLMALNGVFGALEQGTKDDATSKPWFGLKKNERDDDELLRYLYHARNAEQHALAPVARHSSGGIAIGGPGESVDIDRLTFGPTCLRGNARNTDGRAPRVELVPGRAELVTVKDCGVEFAPPKCHFGVTITDTSPLGVAKLGFTYH